MELDGVANDNDGDSCIFVAVTCNNCTKLLLTSVYNLSKRDLVTMGFRCRYLLISSASILISEWHNKITRDGSVYLFHVNFCFFYPDFQFSSPMRGKSVGSSIFFAM